VRFAETETLNPSLNTEIVIGQPAQIFTFTVNITQTTGGTVTVMNGATPVTHGQKIEEGTVLSLSVSASSGYEFEKWWDNNANASRTFTLEDNVTISATFTAIVTPPIKHTVNITQAIGGTVTVMNGATPVTNGQEIEAGTVLTLSASATNSNYEFEKWWDNNPSASRTFALNANVTIRAIFNLDFDTYIVVKWDNTLMLDLKELSKEHTITGSRWFKDGVQQSAFDNQFTYSAGTRSSDVLNGTYHFELITSNNGTLSSTKKTFNNVKASVLAYPNPVRTGNLLTIEGVTEGSPIQVFNQLGMSVYNTIATGSSVQFILNAPAGIYIIRTKDGDVRIIIN